MKNSKTVKHFVKNLPIYAALLVAVVIFAFPFIWMLLTSFKTLDETIKIPVQFFPKKLIFENYREVIAAFPMMKWYINSMIVTGITIFGQIVIGAMAGYGFARLYFPFKNVIFIMFLALMMVPEQIYIFTRYDLMLSWGLANTTTAMWLPKIFSIFAVFFFRQFIQSIPRELDEAAMIDGCGYTGIFLRIILPTLKNAFVSLAILAGLAAWKDLMWPIIVVQDVEKLTVIAGLARLADKFNGKYQYLMVGGVLGTFPVIILFFILQKRFVQSIASEGIKQ